MYLTSLQVSQGMAIYLKRSHTSCIVLNPGSKFGRGECKQSIPLQHQQPWPRCPVPLLLRHQSSAAPAAAEPGALPTPSSPQLACTVICLIEWTQQHTALPHQAWYKTQGGAPLHATATAVARWSLNYLPAE